MGRPSSKEVWQLDSKKPDKKRGDKTEDGEMNLIHVGALLGNRQLTMV